MLAIIASLRLEIAIPLPEKDEDAAGLLMMAIASILTFSGLFAVIGSVFPSIFSTSLDEVQLRVLVWAVPIGAMVTSAYSVLQYWTTRKRLYRRSSNVRIFQATIETGSQIGTGTFGMGALGLIGGQVIGRVVAVFSLAIPAYKDVIQFRSLATWEHFRSLAHTYRRFPLLSTPDSLINISGLQASIILIAAFVDTASAGMLFMAFKILQLPIGLVANAISQVYLTELPAQIRRGSDSAMTTQLMKDLADFAVGPIIFVAITAEIFLGLFLGEQWHMAGRLMIWMLPWMALLMLVSPISVILHAKNLSHISLWVNCFGLVIRCTPILILGWNDLSRYIPEVFSICSALFYLVRLSVCMRFANVNPRDIFLRRKSILIYSAWIIPSVSLILLFS